MIMQGWGCKACRAGRTSRGEAGDCKEQQDGRPQEVVWLHHSKDGILVRELKDGAHLQPHNMPMSYMHVAEHVNAQIRALPHRSDGNERGGYEVHWEGQV